ncbi:LytTR family DNA-binding domain-containing protein [Vagococcus silagei]|uniref:LytTR family transcriptional regulator n=1 Tax=Vagococcus silagei TaxID=2508885 RepID=A0A4S3B3W7_9ENTE|nr:LytTR family DNA-binding domain-containing protein [Vagococcus silagei]THB61824.1 LytTR family transcriptional regulator [Vagococcus silagei]
MTVEIQYSYQVIQNNQSDEVQVISSTEHDAKLLMNKIKNCLTHSPTLYLTHKNQQLIIEQAQIYFAEVFQNNLVIHTKEDNYEITKTLKSFHKMLSPQNFVQISKSTIINLNYLTRLEVAFSGNYYAYLKGQHQVTVSRRFVTLLKSAIERKVD